MGEEKVTFRPSRDGRWVAHTGEVGYAADTPWEASAMVCAAYGKVLPIEWETLPWLVQREAHGITQGVCAILGASLEARRAIDTAVYAEEMLELGAGRYVSLSAKERAELAAAAAGRILREGEYGRKMAERALKWTDIAASHLPGYGRALRLLGVALASGSPSRLRTMRLMERARSAVVAANLRNDIAPDSR
ncbi:hypothetical protein WMF38_57240 [Sorangium sp. So ce118]